MAKTKRRLSEAERAERRRRDRERLQRAAEQLLTSEGWQRWVRVRSQAALARLSLSNQLLVALARPDATFVAGFKSWLRLGFAVKKGERGIAIIAPLAVKERDRVSGEETSETLVLFKTVFVFDRAQVAPIDGVEQAVPEPPCEPLTGDSHAHLIEPLRAFAETLGFTVSFEAIEGPVGGWCDSKRKRIVVDAGAPANAQLRTLIHELAHSLGLGYADYGRGRCEVLVDCVTYVVLGSVGLDVGGESIPYVAGWGEDGALDAIGTYAQTIDEIARRIEDAIAPAATPAADAPAELPGGSAMSRPPTREFIVDITVFTAAGEPLGFEPRAVAPTAEQAALEVAQRLAERHRRPAEDVIVNRVIAR